MRPIALAVALAVPASALAQQSPESAPTWMLVEDLRIGADDGPKSFADLRSVAVTRNGNIFVLDFKQRVIRLFDARGNFLKQVARDGAGPGEIRNANGMAVGSNDIVWVNDPSNSRFTLFKSDGSFYKQVLVPINRYGYMWEGAIDDRGRAIDQISVRVAADGRGTPRGDVKYRIIDETGKADTVDAPRCPPRTSYPDPSYLQFTGGRGSMMMTLPFLPMTQVIHTPSGTAWCTASADYSLWSAPLGQPVKEVVSLKVDPPPVSEEERKQSLNRIDSLTRAIGRMTVGDPSLMPKVKPVIARVHGDPRGRLWVRQTTTPEATPSFDVFDPTGKAVARVNSKGKVSLYQTWITDTHVYTVLLDENDVQTLVRYAIVK